TVLPDAAGPARSALVGLTVLVTAGWTGSPTASAVPEPASSPTSSVCPVTAGATPGAGGADATDPDVRELLRRAEARYDSLSTLRAEFTQTIEMRVFEPPRVKEGTGTWHQKGEGRFRMDFDDPEGDLIVADGRHVWLFYPSSHPGQVVRADVAGSGQGSEMVDLQGHIFEEARTSYRPRYEGRTEVGGRTTHQVILDPPEESSYRYVRVWIDASTLLVRRLAFEDQSETVRTITLSSLEPGVAMADSLFDFEPPPDVEVFEG
ncbi:MAG: LolA family protein, partial [Gemmatimonadota bacterium]